MTKYQREKRHALDDVLYIGKVDRNVTNTYPGFEPVRDPENKWYLSEDSYPDELGPAGIRWISGWGYLVSEMPPSMCGKKLKHCLKGSAPETCMVGQAPMGRCCCGNFLSDYTDLYHHEGFKAAWDSCKNDTVLKHLDNQAHACCGLGEQDRTGLWDKKEVVCSAGEYEPGDYNNGRDGGIHYRCKNSRQDVVH
eukprot:jgi/Picre1/34490/NNA_001958.t1